MHIIRSQVILLLLFITTSVNAAELLNTAIDSTSPVSLSAGAQGAVVEKVNLNSSGGDSSFYLLNLAQYDNQAPLLNIRIYDESTGSQIGALAALPYPVPNGLYSYHWGTVAFKADATIPNNTTKVFTVRADIAATAAGIIQVLWAGTVSRNPGQQYGAVSVWSKAMTVTAAATVLAGCVDIRTGGSYVMNSDITDNLPGQNVPCIQIRYVSGVQLDCRGHNISDADATGGINLAITSAINSSVTNCNFRVQSGGTKASAISIISGSYIVVASNVFGGELSMVYSDHVTFKSNNWLGTLSVSYSTNTNIDSNTMTTRGDVSVPTAVRFQGGSRNWILSNTIYGSFDPLKYNWSNSFGADDGIVLVDEDLAVVASNRISNAYDCGIETVGSITNGLFQGNVIKTAAVCGIGGWYWSSWQNNTVYGNWVDGAPTMFAFYHAHGMRSGDSRIYFKDNIFRANLFTTPRNFGYPGDVSTPSGQFNFGYLSTTLASGDARLAVPSDLITSGNVFTNNNFGRIAPAPAFVKHPSQAAQFVVDGSGNICGTVNAADYPIRCN